MDAVLNGLLSWGPLVGLGLVIGWLAGVAMTLWLLCRKYDDQTRYRWNLEQHNNMARYRVDPGDRT
jgi:hypothetical protein